jgi:ATP-binding cassette, subfamily B, bacterial
MQKKYSSVSIVLEFLKISFKSHKLYTIVFILVPVLNGLVPFANAFIIKQIVDFFTHTEASEQTMSVFAVYALLLVSLRFISSLFQKIETFTRIRLRDEIAPVIQYMYISKINRLPYAAFEDQETYDLIDKTERGIDWRPLTIIEIIPEILSTLIGILVAIPIVLIIGWWIIPLIIITTIPKFIIANKASNIEYSISDSRSPVARKHGYVQALQMRDKYVKEIRLFNTGPKLWNIALSIFKGFSDTNAQIATKNFWFTLLGDLLQVVSICGTYIFIFGKAFTQQITIGSLTFFIDVVTGLSSNITQFFYAISRMRGHAIFLQDFFKLLDQPEESSDGDKLTNYDFQKIEFKNVSFKYPHANKYIFENLNLTINRGEKIAVVGVNGAGKTTFIKLLLGFFPPTEGQILIDGKDIQQINKKDWYKYFGALFQDFNKYAFTARENIEFGDPDKSDEEIYNSAKEKSDAASVISDLEKKDDQILSAQFDGVDISGGQWQRIALARMYFRDSPILILDEPTAAIDAISEAKIFESVQTLSQEKTVIIISHRFSTVRRANRIIVLDEGTILEEGSHESLMEKNGQYAKMFSLQAEGYK